MFWDDLLFQKGWLKKMWPSEILLFPGGFGDWTRNVLKREKQVSKLGHPHKITNAFYFHYMDPSYPILFLHLNYHISRTWSKIHDYIPKLIVSYLINSNILHLKFQFLSRYNHFEQHFSILNEIQKFYLIK